MPTTREKYSYAKKYFTKNISCKIKIYIPHLYIFHKKASQYRRLTVLECSSNVPCPKSNQIVMFFLDSVQIMGATLVT